MIREIIKDGISEEELIFIKSRYQELTKVDDQVSYGKITLKSKQGYFFESKTSLFLIEKTASLSAVLDIAGEPVSTLKIPSESEEGMDLLPGAVKEENRFSIPEYES